MSMELNQPQVEESLLQYIKSDLCTDGSQSISSSDDLLESGVLDSLAIVLLTEFISSRFALEIDADDVTPENFETVAAITNLITSKIAQ